MRKMINPKSGQELVISEHIILRNFWEYYVISDEGTSEDMLCLVMGDYQEMGWVSMAEIKPYIFSKTKVTKKTELMPADGWQWA